MDCTQVFCESDNEKSMEYTESTKVGYLEVKGVQYAVYSGKNRIGRDPEFCTIIFNNMTLSKEHAIIEAKSRDNHLIYDLASKNRTKLGKMYLEPHVRYHLQNKAVLQFGDLVAVYHQLNISSEELSGINIIDETLEDIIVDTPAPQRSRLIKSACGKLVADNIFEAETQCGCFMKNCGCANERNQSVDEYTSGDFNVNTRKPLNSCQGNQVTPLSPETSSNNGSEGKKSGVGCAQEKSVGRTGSGSCLLGEASKATENSLRALGAIDEDSDATDAEDIFSDSVSPITRGTLKGHVEQDNTSNHSVSPSTLEFGCELEAEDTPNTAASTHNAKHQENGGGGVGATVEGKENLEDNNVPGTPVSTSIVKTVQQKDIVPDINNITEIPGSSKITHTADQKENEYNHNVVVGSSVETVEVKDTLDHNNIPGSPSSPSIVECEQKDDIVDNKNVSGSPSSPSVVESVEQKYDILDHKNVSERPGLPRISETAGGEPLVYESEKVSVSPEASAAPPETSVHEKEQNESNGSSHDSFDCEAPTQKLMEDKIFVGCVVQSGTSARNLTPKRRQCSCGLADGRRTEVHNCGISLELSTLGDGSIYGSIHDMPTQVIGEEYEAASKGRQVPDSKVDCSLISNSSIYSSIHEAPTQEIGAENVDINKRMNDINITPDNIASSGSYEYGPIHDAPTLPLVDDDEPAVVGRRRAEGARQESGDETDPEDTLVHLATNTARQKACKENSDSDVDISLAPTQILSPDKRETKIEVLYDLPTQVVDGRAFQSEGHRADFEMADICNMQTQVLNEVTPKKATSAPEMLRNCRVPSTSKGQEMCLVIFDKQNQVLNRHANSRQEESDIHEKGKSSIDTSRHGNPSTSKDTIHDMATQILEGSPQRQNVTDDKATEAPGDTTRGPCTSTPLFPRRRGLSEEERAGREIELILPNSEELLAVQRAILDEVENDNIGLESTDVSGSPAIQRHKRCRERKSSKQEDSAEDTSLENDQNPTSRPVRNRKKTWKVMENLKEESTSDECVKRAKIETKASRKGNPKERGRFNSGDESDFANDKNNAAPINRADTKVGKGQPKRSSKKANAVNPKITPQTLTPTSDNSPVRGPLRDRRNSSISPSSGKSDLAKEMSDVIPVKGDAKTNNTRPSRAGKGAAANKPPNSSKVMTIPNAKANSRNRTLSSDDGTDVGTSKPVRTKKESNVTTGEDSNSRPSRSRKKANNNKTPSCGNAMSVTISKKKAKLDTPSDSTSVPVILLQGTPVCTRETTRRVVSEAKNNTDVKKPEVAASPVLEKGHIQRKKKGVNKSENKRDEERQNTTLLQKDQNKETSNDTKPIVATPTQKTTSKNKSEIQTSAENIRPSRQGKNKNTINEATNEVPRKLRANTSVTPKSEEQSKITTRNVKCNAVQHQLKTKKNENPNNREVSLIDRSSSSTASITDSSSYFTSSTGSETRTTESSTRSSELGSALVAPPPSPDSKTVENTNIQDKRKSARSIEHRSEDSLEVKTSLRTRRNQERNSTGDTPAEKPYLRRKRDNFPFAGSESKTSHIADTCDKKEEVVSDINLAEKKPGLLNITTNAVQSSRKNTRRTGKGLVTLQQIQSDNTCSILDLSHEEDVDKQLQSRVKRRKVLSSPSRKSPSTSDSQTSHGEGTPKRSSRLTLKLTHHIMFTGISCTDLEKGVIKKLGGTVVEKPELCSVLVTDKVRRTVKFLYMMGQGKPIVSLDWIWSSEEAGYFLDPWNYLVNDKEAEGKFGFHIRESLTAALQRKMLGGFSVHVTPKVKPIPLELKGIVESCGGVYLPRIPSGTLPDKCFIISCAEDKSLWNKFKKVPLVSAEAILTGVLKQKLDLKMYSLE